MILEWDHMEEPRTYEELKAQSDAFDARLAALNARLTVLDNTHPPSANDRNSKRKHARWEQKMLALTQHGDQWGHEYLDFLRTGEPLLAKWAGEDPSLQDELTAWRDSMAMMEKSLSSQGPIDGS
jgi:hypothetical protein